VEAEVIPGVEKAKPTDAEKKELRAALKDEVITIAKMIGSMGSIKLLVIDTENKFVSTGVAKEIASAAGGRYHYIPKASADAMKQVTMEAVSSLKQTNRAR
jgi:magnesium chelatase subunit D